MDKRIGQHDGNVRHITVAPRCVERCDALADINASRNVQLGDVEAVGIHCSNFGRLVCHAAVVEPQAYELQAAIDESIDLGKTVIVGPVESPAQLTTDV